MGQVGFAGSTQLGDYVVVASQSGIADHLKIGNQAVIAAKSGVMRDVPDGGRVIGIPASPERQGKRQHIAIQQLPDMIHRMRELEKQVEQLAEKCAALEGGSSGTSQRPLP
jgi:UDP-3-O-[3-hydroxymyristoyl] glucosamine N-acyltransferase